VNAKPDTARVLLRVPNWLGDSVMALPAVAALRAARPGLSVSVLARSPFDEFWAMTGVNAVVALRVRPGLAGLADRRQMAVALRKQCFDAALILPNSFDSALVPWLARIPARIGRPRDGRSALLTERIPFPRHMRGRHLSRWYAYLVQYWLGVPLEVDYDVRITPPADACEAVGRQRAQLRDCVIGLNPGATYGPAKRWPSERFAEVAVRACRELNASVLTMGGPGDVATCTEVMQAICGLDATAATHCVNVAGRCSLAESAAWLQHCRCLVTNDTGGMHLGAAVGTPVVAIFGPTNPGETSPLGNGHRLIVADVPCGPCLKRECRMDTHRCMESITVDRVWQDVISAPHARQAQAAPAS
jgi:heptosyltransferase-2